MRNSKSRSFLIRFSTVLNILYRCPCSKRIVPPLRAPISPPNRETKTRHEDAGRLIVSLHSSRENVLHLDASHLAEKSSGCSYWHSPFCLFTAGSGLPRHPLSSTGSGPVPHSRQTITDDEYGGRFPNLFIPCQQLALGLFATDRKRPACCCSLFNLMAFVDAINLYQDPCPDPCRLDEDRDKDRDKDSDASSRPPNGDIPVSHELENRAPSSCTLFVLRFVA